MRRKKIRLRYKKERVLFSDVLPYELPLIFSNRYFYRFIVKNKIWIDINAAKDGKDILHWDKQSDQTVLFILSMLFCRPVLDFKGKDSLVLNSSHDLKRIPFIYSIKHKPTKNRYLSIIHPVNQIKMVEFYDKYKDAIIYLCNKSNFSMRFPSKVASYFYYKDRLHHILLGQKTDRMEMFFSEYENLKTYFSYKKYTNIFKFYDDYRYQRAEKKFSHLLKMDLQSCFDSIYTHSIAWAINGGVDIYKDTFDGSFDKSIGAVWDKMMQEMNYSETNGIVIGPEFSRLFAEVILQHIDQRVEQGMLASGFMNKVHYECYRYVDDYFFFYNDESVKNEAVQLFQKYLNEYKLSISNDKTSIFERPFITEITKAKIDIDELIKGAFNVRVKESVDNDSCIDEDETEQETTEEVDEIIIKVDRKKASTCLSTNIDLYLNATEFNKRFKKIVTSNGVEIKDILNYTISRIAIRTERVLKKFDSVYKVVCFILADHELFDIHSEAEKKREKLEKIVTLYLFEVIDSVFFLYSSSKRINTTLKVMQVLNTIRIYLDHDYTVGELGKEHTISRFTEYAREIVFKKIKDEISLVFQTAPMDDNIQLETLYFLIVLRSMNRKYMLEPEELCRYLKIRKDDSGIHNDKPYFNALSVILLVYYFGNMNKYLDLKKAIIKDTLVCMKNVPTGRRHISAEFSILALDMATCPYIRFSDRAKFLKNMGFSDSEANKVVLYLKTQKIMFTKWTGVDITKELNAKISQEVYS